MRSMFELGIRRPGLGQFWEAVVPAIATAAVGIYRARSEKEIAEDALEFKEEQAASAAAREAEALRIQQEAIKALQQQNQPKTTATGAPGVEGTIMGLKPTTFYIAAGLTAGVLVLGTMLITKGAK